MTEEEWAAWPKCAIGPCQRKSCLRLGSKYCWPHTPGVLDGSTTYRELVDRIANIAEEELAKTTYC